MSTTKSSAWMLVAAPFIQQMIGVMLCWLFPRFMVKVCIREKVRLALTSSRTCGSNVADTARNGVVVGT